MYYFVCSVTHIFNFFYCNPIDYPSREYCRKMKTTVIYWYTVKELINSIQNEFLKKKSLVLKKGKIYVKHIVSFLKYAFRLFISQTK